MTIHTVKTANQIQSNLEYFGKDTKRKQKLFITKWIADNSYIIEHIEPQIAIKDFAWHLGTKMYKAHLKAITLENELLINYRKLI